MSKTLFFKGIEMPFGWDKKKADEFFVYQNPNVKKSVKRDHLMDEWIKEQISHE
jgi:hypothetical protein